MEFIKGWISRFELKLLNDLLVYYGFIITAFFLGGVQITHNEF